MKKLLILLAITAGISSCLDGRTINKQDGAVGKDSSLFLNKHVQLGDSAQSLIRRGIVTPDISMEDVYHPLDETYAGVDFREATILTKDGRVNGIFYISHTYNSEDAFRRDFSKVLSYLNQGYKQTTDTSYTGKEPLFKVTTRDYTFVSPTHVVELSFNEKRWKPYPTGEKTYSFSLMIDIQDSIIKKHHLENLFYK